jgi:hypothetical protein
LQTISDYAILDLCEIKNEVMTMKKVMITKSDRVMRKFKGMMGIVTETCADGAVIEFEVAITKRGQKSLFFRFDQFEYIA